MPNQGGATFLSPQPMTHFLVCSIHLPAFYLSFVPLYIFLQRMCLGAAPKLNRAGWYCQYEADHTKQTWSWTSGMVLELKDVHISQKFYIQYKAKPWHLPQEGYADVLSAHTHTPVQTIFPLDEDLSTVSYEGGTPRGKERREGTEET